MHGTISPNSNNNRGLATYLHYAAFPLGVTLLIATTVYIFVLSTPRMDMIVDHPSKSQRNQQQLRSRSNFLAPLEEHDEFHQMNDLLLPSLWNDVFLSPLMEIDPFFRQHQTTNANMWQDLVFDVTQNEDSVSLTTSIPDVPLRDINIEVIDGTVLHIHGEKHTSGSHVRFDKTFALGHHLDESNIKAKLTKAGELIVTAPKVGKSTKREIIRNIPIMEEL